MSETVLRRALPADADALTHLTIASKAYWGYSKSFMSKAMPFLKVTTDQIETDHVYLLEEKSRIVGYYQLDTRLPNTLWMESLFVLPEAIGKGYGAQLLHHAIDLAKSLGYQRIEFESDPNAEAFYLKMGAVRIGANESGIQKGRMLPLMRLQVAVPEKR